MLLGFGLVIASLPITFLNPANATYMIIRLRFALRRLHCRQYRRRHQRQVAGQAAPGRGFGQVAQGAGQPHRLYNYILPAEHVLLTPAGITVFQVRRIAGPISCTGDKWTHKRSLMRRLRLGADEQVGEPAGTSSGT